MSKALVGMKKGGGAFFSLVKKSGAFVVVDMEVAKVKFKRRQIYPSQAPAPTPVPAAAQQPESSPAIQGNAFRHLLARKVTLSKIVWQDLQERGMVHLKAMLF